jgi:hypothetical protein
MRTIVLGPRGSRSFIFPIVRWIGSPLGLLKAELQRCASVPNPQVQSLYNGETMAKPKQAPGTPEETLEQLLDRVSNTREELVAIERTLERLRLDISKLQKNKDGSGNQH